MAERITAERLRELLSYDPETGVFRRRQSFKRWLAGDVAGCPNQLTGYIRIGIEPKQYQAHRLAWLYMTGEWPKDQIDHINLNRADNRWANLREASNGQNMRNGSRRSDNTSGFKGVSFHKASGLWQAYIFANGRKKSLQYYKTAEEAHLAYCAAATEHFGEFARFA